MTRDIPQSGKTNQGRSQNTSPQPEEKKPTPKCCCILDILRTNNWKKKYANCLLALVLVMCSLWQVEEVLFKFIEGSTTATLEKQQNEHLPLPRVALCMKQRYNYRALAAMGLPDDYFSEYRHRTEFDMKRQFSDLNQTWLNATWSKEDIQMAAAVGATHTSASFSVNDEGNILLPIYSSLNRVSN